MEIWKDIPGYEGYYQASSFGQIKSFKRRGNWKDRILRPNRNRRYLIVNLKIPGVNTKELLVHRLIAETFISNPENKPIVNHKNGNKHDNHVDNLEWVTYSKNNQHAFDMGLISKENLARSHQKKIDQFDSNNHLIKTWRSIKEAGENLNLSRSGISRCCNGRKGYSQVGGFIWKFHKD